jgi:type IV secretory pathway TrbD component
MKIPLYQALTERIMLAGVPRKIAILTGTAGAAAVFGLQNLYVVPFVLILHYVLVLLYKIDPYFVEIIIQHIKEDDYLFP